MEGPAQFWGSLLQTLGTEKLLLLRLELDKELQRRDLRTLTEQTLRFNEKKWPFFKVCLDAQCPCQYFPDKRVKDISAAEMRCVDPATLFVKNVTRGKRAEQMVQVVSHLKLGVVRLFVRDDEIPFKPDMAEFIYGVLSQLGLDQMRCQTTWGDAPMFLDASDAPIPVAMRTPGRDFIFCTFRNHQEAALAQQILTPLGFLCNFENRGEPN